MPEGNVIDDTAFDLERIQNFDAESLVQREKLGSDLAFDDAVLPAQRIILLFKKVPLDVLGEFPNEQLIILQAQAKNAFNLFDSVIKFKSTNIDAEGTKMSLISQIEAAYQPAFNYIYPLISFAVARKVDFNALAAEGRTAVQSIKDNTAKVVAELKETSESAAQVLKEVREAAAEQGVTQQAKYFADESTAHLGYSKKWLFASVCMAIIVLIYSVSTLFFTKIPLLTAATPTEAVQITASKFLVFFVLVYALFQCVKNYSSNMHNSIVNKHRQNSLMTYKTLTEAGGSPEAREVVLQHAASAIYAPSDTGYVKNEERGSGDNALIGMFGRAIPGGLSGSGSGTP
jgi:hypothetical protein